VVRKAWERTTEPAKEEESEINSTLGFTSLLPPVVDTKSSSNNTQEVLPDDDPIKSYKVTTLALPGKQETVTSPPPKPVRVKYVAPAPQRTSGAVDNNKKEAKKPKATETPRKPRAKPQISQESADEEDQGEKAGESEGEDWEGEWEDPFDDIPGLVRRHLGLSS
jgi:hypothetical protein